MISDHIKRTLNIEKEILNKLKFKQLLSSFEALLTHS